MPDVPPLSSQTGQCQAPDHRDLQRGIQRERTHARTHARTQSRMQCSVICTHVVKHLKAGFDSQDRHEHVLQCIIRIYIYIINPKLLLHHLITLRIANSRIDLCLQLRLRNPDDVM